jgi:AraC-like DNA-binding protein
MDEILVNPSDERRILDFRPLGFRDVVVLGRYQYAAAHEPLPDHCHGNMLEICYLESGEQSYLVKRERFDLTGGDVFVTFPEEPHGSGGSPEGKGVLFWMLLRVPAGKRRFLSLAPPEARLLLDSLLELPYRQFRSNRAMKKTLYDVFAAYDRVDDPLRIVNLRNLLLRFLLDVIDASRGSPSRLSPAIREVQRFIGENIDVMLTVRQMARLAGMSESRLKARFKAEVGVPPADYMMRQKIERAKRLLHGGRSVTHVAMELGFSTSQYFATVFKRYTGRTPSRHRSEGLDLAGR